MTDSTSSDNSKFGSYLCPCCGYLTLSEPPPGTFEICSICGWEDDDYQVSNPDSGGGANPISLNQARINYRKIGASEERWKKRVRPPKPEEIPSEKRRE